MFNVSALRSCAATKNQELRFHSTARCIVLRQFCNNLRLSQSNHFAELRTLTSQSCHQSSFLFWQQ